MVRENETNKNFTKEGLVYDEEGFVKLADIAYRLLGGRDTEYISRLVDKLDSEYEFLGEDLNFKNVFDKNGTGTGSYHDYMLHKDDIEEFVKRVKDYYGEV
ncbi:MAG: hypothetical protein KBD26_01780 [Candidatus Pacebacteria bacterium]|nr:hypothetical protein [Candidatus Paceibacterota bacterium]MBP9772541.1 hypothetical protein [Candidatus Paceibacterota bacterium]